MRRLPAVAWPIAVALTASGCFQSEAPREAATPTTGESPSRVQAVTEIGERGDPASVPALAAMLRNDPDPAIRSEAAYAIADAGNPADTVFIAQALSDPDRNVRRAAIQSLVGAGDESSAAWLALALNDPDPRMRMDAVEALGEVGGVAARSALLQALNDSDADVRTMAAQMLDEPERQRR